jgi:hypothetical protein
MLLFAKLSYLKLQLLYGSFVTGTFAASLLFRTVTWCNDVLQQKIKILNTYIIDTS